MKLKLIHLPLLYSSSTIKIYLCATTDFMNKVPGVYTFNGSINLSVHECKCSWGNFFRKSQVQCGRFDGWIVNTHLPQNQFYENLYFMHYYTFFIIRIGYAVVGFIGAFGVLLLPISNIIHTRKMNVEWNKNVAFM